ncbi:MAG: 4Fe-4S dicluster domain-containing protein [Armatimonadetes bacterium]|nr:4Fe-4S dicluster domain-containing protein [Armatimonadota bacterium]
MPRMAMLIDLTRCIGCDACTIACKQENGTPVNTFFARVLNVEAGTYPNVKRVYIPVLCNHCDDAPCLKACPNKAIFRRDDGIVLIDQDRCKGTGACVSACPYGNVYLTKTDEWYLNEDEPYERDFVKPRLKENVARKCTYCAHRVDQGLDPACVVACPTTARIFGDLDDPDSAVSKYIVEQKELTGRDTFHLLPQAKTKPAGLYLGTMSDQESHTHGNRATATGVEPVTSKAQRSIETRELEAAPAQATGKKLRLLPIIGSLILLAAAALASGQEDVEVMERIAPSDVYSTSTCMGCHGITGNGGIGPPIAETKLTEMEFLAIIRDGKGMMPATPAEALSDEDARSIYSEMRAKEVDEDQIPIAYKVGRVLSTKSVMHIFLFAGLFSIFFGLKVLFYWIKISGAWGLLPHLKKFGFGKAIGVFSWSLIVDGFLVASLWRKNKQRWFLHGLMLYGMFGLLLADMLMQIYNPSRGDLELTHPIKLLAIVAGAAVIYGVGYVMVRYKTDEYMDNGLTLGRDFLFVNLLFHTVLSGFMTLTLNKAGVNDWLMTIYIYHLTSVALLIMTAPFTRFAHAFVVPVLVGITRVGEELVASGVNIAFEREPSPGRHHKSEQIAAQVMAEIDPGFEGPIRLRYYP